MRRDVEWSWDRRGVGGGVGSSGRCLRLPSTPVNNSTLVEVGDRVTATLEFCGTTEEAAADSSQ